MPRLLVTGGAGFIGANFVHYWHRRHPEHRLVVLDALTYAGQRSSLSPLEEDAAVCFVHGDILDGDLVEKLLRREKLDTIVHFAAQTHVDRSIQCAADFIAANIQGTHSLLEAARKVWLEGDGRKHRFHHVSTDEVYGSLREDEPAFTESSAYRPNSPYAASKAASDHLVRAWHRTYGLETTISNCSNNYGPFQHPEKLIPLTILNLLHGRQVPVYGDGRQIRDWLHVEDHCRGIELALDRGAPGAVYNLGGGAAQRNVELVELICNLVDRAFESETALRGSYPRAPPACGQAASSLIRFVADRPGHDRRYVIDYTRAADALEYAPVVSLADGLEQTVAWYLSRNDWWLPLLDADFRAWIDRQYG
jgi:dTDP-glucose 4,6-dehydratase